MKSVQVSAFRWVPPFAQGLVRDLRVRWALEEAGVGYETALLSLGEQSAQPYRSWQPFGQVPAVKIDGQSLFESGAIVMFIAERFEALMPRNDASRTAVMQWVFAALNTIEPPITMLVVMTMPNQQDQSNSRELQNRIEQWIGQRLDQLGDVLHQSAYLVDGKFSAADLMMCSVLRALRTTDLVAKRPVISEYCARIEGRPAFQRALAAQLDTFEKNAPPSGKASGPERPS